MSKMKDIATTLQEGEDPDVYYRKRFERGSEELKDFSQIP